MFSNKKIYIVVLIISLLSFGGMRAMANENSNEKKSFDIKEMIFSHVLDSYEWHLFSSKDKHYSIPLPIIVKGENGWEVFSSAKIKHSQVYKGFYIAENEPYKYKVVYSNQNGEEIRPLDFSFTKNAAAALLASIILIIIFLSIAKQYKRDPMRSMKGFSGAIEQLTMSLHDDLIKPSIPNNYQKFAPYLLTVFYFIFLNNMLGLIPIFPGGANVTGNIAVTLTLALITFFMTNVFGNKEYWKEIFWPDVPVFLKTPIFPLMQIIEFIGVITKPFSLMIRLFANMLAGHMILLVLVGLIFMFSALLGIGAALGVSVVSMLFSIFIVLLDVLVSFIQAYVFTILSAIFIGMAQPEPHAIKEIK